MNHIDDSDTHYSIATSGTPRNIIKASVDHSKLKTLRQGDARNFDASIGSCSDMQAMHAGERIPRGVHAVPQPDPVRPFTRKDINPHAYCRDRMVLVLLLVASDNAKHTKHDGSSVPSDGKRISPRDVHLRNISTTWQGSRVWTMLVTLNYSMSARRLRVCELCQQKSIVESYTFGYPRSIHDRALSVQPSAESTTASERCIEHVPGLCEKPCSLVAHTSTCRSDY